MSFPPPACIPRLSAALLAACSCNVIAAADFYDTVNRLRAGQGTCAVTQQLAPLTRQPALERAAQGLARGHKLQDSVRESGYRAATSGFISITGDGVSETAGALLGKQYCGQLLGATLTDIGIYQDARQLWIVMAAPFAPQVSLAPEAAAQRVLELVNQARTEARSCGGKPFKAAGPLRWNAVLAAISLQHAADMAQYNYFSHSGRDGSSPAARVEHGGYNYRATAENIAGGQTRPEDAVAAWIKSPLHCVNLMNPAYTEMGVAYAVNKTSELGIYWTQVFGTPP
jgi:uncharacterized protein YkwD